ncbi:hypothetical protein SOV_13660 [Sporomusa ovata DSM 2662]|uniref:Uncharacterized protein n=1 Tax=Sporomusa ovata TaxID=2378 RepID=A0A0U1KYP9_9FIRM|nr:hypothetical protein [Sporomusa ovata]EQB28973.1 hypothetical protein SOV_1c07020 [Sporomusa ovata DSM 2662]CQR72405.1 hypothetical protein SpAn4DRAFT_2865 [Sporomusa ovata]
MLPVEMQNCIKYLEQNSFILKCPSEAAICLREIAVEYVNSKLINNKVVAVLLTGSSACGYSGMGSDIDLDVLIDGNSKPIKKIMFKGIPIDLQFKSYTEWRNDCLAGGESVRYLTHTIPIYDRDTIFLEFQKDILQQYYSLENMQKQFKRSFEVISKRSYYGVADARKGFLVPAAINIESALYEAISLLIYRYKGFTATSLLLAEFDRISKILEHGEWFNKTVKHMRFDISHDQSEELLKTYNELFVGMRRLLATNRDLVKRIRRMNLDYYTAGNQLEELCSEINYQQLYDKIMKTITGNKIYKAGMSLFFESHYNFFMFSPFFYLKNINSMASGKEIVNTSFWDLLDCWDDNIKKLWKKVYRANLLTEKSLIEMANLSNEIVSFCSFN